MPPLESRALGIFSSARNFAALVQPPRDAHRPYILVQLLSHGLRARFRPEPDAYGGIEQVFCADA
jgi:hypothetical protein